MQIRAVGAVVPFSIYLLAQLSLGALPARAQTCPVADLALNTTVNSRLSETSCGYHDLVPGSTLSVSVQPFSLTVTSQGILTLDMSGSFDTNVYVVDSEFYRYEPDLEDPASLKPGNNSRLTISLTPGTYMVMATSASPDQFGDFSLKAGWSAPPNCVIEDLPTPGLANASLAQTDCRVLDIVAPSTDTARVKRYRVATSTAGALDLRLASTAFASVLEVRDKNNVEIDSTVSDFGVTENDMTVSLQPDTHLVYVSSNDGKLGAYSLSVSFSGLRSCSPAALNLNGIFQQWSNLAPATSCRYLDLVVPSSDVSLVTPYSLLVDRTGLVQIDMQSKVFDSYVEVLDANGKSLGWDSSNGANFNFAVLATSLNPGKYTVLASTTDYGSGAYTIQASSSDLRSCPGADAGSQVSGSLGGKNDCRVMDVIIPSSDTTPVGRYNITLSQKSAVRLQASSSNGTLPALGVYDEKLQFVNGASASPSSKYAVLNTLLLPGDYAVLVRLAGANAGSFGLDTMVQQPRNCPLVALAAGVPATGAFSNSDCIASDLLVGSNSSVSAQQFSFTAPTAGTLTLSVSSADTSTVIKLVSASDVVLGSAVGHSTPGEIQVNVPAGVFKVLVMPWAGTQGSFQLQGEFRPALAPPAQAPIRNPGSGRRSNGV